MVQLSWGKDKNCLHFLSIYSHSIRRTIKMLERSWCPFLWDSEKSFLRQEVFFLLAPLLLCFWSLIGPASILIGCALLLIVLIGCALVLIGCALVLMGLIWILMFLLWPSDTHLVSSASWRPRWSRIRGCGPGAAGTWPRRTIRPSCTWAGSPQSAETGAACSGTRQNHSETTPVRTHTT